MNSHEDNFNAGFAAGIAYQQGKQTAPSATEQPAIPAGGAETDNNIAIALDKQAQEFATAYEDESSDKNWSDLHATQFFALCRQHFQAQATPEPKGTDVIQALRQAMDDSALPSAYRPDMVGYFSMAYNKLLGRSDNSAPLADRAGWKIGDTLGPNECGVWEAGIHVGPWGNRIECYGNTKVEAEALRDQLFTNAPTPPAAPTGEA